MQKKMTMRLISFLKITSILLLFSFPLQAQDKLMSILNGELKREMNELKKEEIKPYYIAYNVSDSKHFRSGASFGALTGKSDISQFRFLSVIVRVGDYSLDNTHEIRGDISSQLSSYETNSIQIPITENEDALKALIWRETNKRYRQAVEEFSKVKANVAVKVKEEESTADFSKEKKSNKYYEPPLDFDKLLGDKSIWEPKVKKHSQPFLEDKNIIYANASFSFELQRRYVVTSEGTEIAQNLTYCYFSISAMTKSEDGMEQSLYQPYFGYLPKDIPEDKIIAADVESLMKNLKILRTAPTVEPYTGPAILTGKAAGVFFHEIFGHRVEGHRLKKSDDAQTFKKKINEKVLPEHMSVIFDPALKEMNGVSLNGYYRYDDEGIEGKKVTVVESGILKDFLMSRSPLEKIKYSNGHARANIGKSPVSRQSNLIVTSTAALSTQELRNKLIDECKKQGKEFGLVFDQVAGGFTTTGRFMPNAFNVTPLLVYKIYVDGRPDEIVRGVDLVGTPLLIFSNISQVGNDYGVFNGTCGAESGGIPVSCVSPSLLVSQIEVQKKAKSQEKPTILPRPDTEISRLEKKKN